MARPPPDRRERAAQPHLREIAWGLAAAFALNWIWENAQAPLYRGYAGFAEHLRACTIAALGDVLLVASIHVVVAAAWRTPAWHRAASPPKYLLSAVLGIVIGVAIELDALESGRWAYGSMPLIPFTGIGLLPILQMTLLPPVVFAIMRRA